MMERDRLARLEKLKEEGAEEEEEEKATEGKVEEKEKKSKIDLGVLTNIFKHTGTMKIK